MIQPPEEAGVETLMPHFKGGMGHLGYKPPLGILYVATALSQHGDHGITVIDAIAEELDCAQLAARVEALAPDVVGISAWTDFWYSAHRCGQLIKAALPDCHLTYGGPHIGIFAEETLDIDFVDSVIAGDGEVPFLKLCEMISGGALSGDVPGLHIKGFGVKPAAEWMHIERDLDSLPIPDRTLLPVDRYASVLGHNACVTTMITSRGCPHACTFCKLNFQKNIAHSAARVVEEFACISALGIEEVEIYDDTFTWGQKRLRDICNGLIEKGLHRKIRWSVRDRVSSSDPELLGLMYRAGCRRIHFGVESGVQAVIDRMQKRITLDQARAAVGNAKKAGLITLTHFMFGNFGETVSDMRQTIRFARELDPDYAEFSITIPYAGTEMYTEALATGMIATDYWGAHARAPRRNLRPQIIEHPADFGTLQTVMKEALRSFYFRPGYMLREVARLKSPGEFVRKARMGIKLFQAA